jgi:hypothetical protein
MVRPCDDGRVTDEPQIEFFVFKARKYCAWLDTTLQSGHYDALRATHVVSGLIASAAKLMRVRIAGQPQTVGPPVDSARVADTPALEFPVGCRPGWAEICRHRERTGGLPGCLIEVQGELRHGLALLDQGCPYDAVSHWQLGWVHNWGELAICSLMMLHTDLTTSTGS